MFSTAIQIGDKVRETIETAGGYTPLSGTVVDLQNDPNGILVVVLIEGDVKFSRYDDQLEWVD
jgi:hypothetical protein